MNIMVNREDCVKTIDEFIQKKNLKEALILVKYLSEIKGFEYKEDEVKTALSNPLLISAILEKTIFELEMSLSIHRISDKNNNLISVF